MRIVVVVFAALLTLGLVTFGVVVAQKATDPVPLTAAAARVSSSQNTEYSQERQSSASHGRGCEGRGTLCTDCSRAEQHDDSGAGFSSFRAGAEAICCVQQSRRARALASH